MGAPHTCEEEPQRVQNAWHSFIMPLVLYACVCTLVWVGVWVCVHAHTHMCTWNPVTPTWLRTQLALNVSRDECIRRNQRAVSRAAGAVACRMAARNTSRGIVRMRHSVNARAETGCRGIWGGA